MIRLLLAPLKNQRLFCLLILLGAIGASIKANHLINYPDSTTIYQQDCFANRPVEEVFKAAQQPAQLFNTEKDYLAQLNASELLSHNTGISELDIKIIVRMDGSLCVSQITSQTGPTHIDLPALAAWIAQQPIQRTASQLGRPINYLHHFRLTIKKGIARRLVTIPFQFGR